MISEPWLSAPKIAERIPLKPCSIRALIKGGHLKHGYHYIDKRLPGRERATYVLNVFRMEEFLSQRPELREGDSHA